MIALNLNGLNQTSAHTCNTQTKHSNTGIAPTLRTPFLYEGIVEAEGIVLVETPLYADQPVHLRAEAIVLTPEQDLTAIDLDLYILDRFGICVASDTTVGSAPSCEFTPIGSGKHLVKIVNTMAYPVAFVLYADLVEIEQEAVRLPRSEGRRIGDRSSQEEERAVRSIRRDRVRRSDRKERMKAKRAYTM